MTSVRTHTRRPRRRCSDLLLAYPTHSPVLLCHPSRSTYHCVLPAITHRVPTLPPSVSRVMAGHRPMSSSRASRTRPLSSCISSSTGRTIRASSPPRTPTPRCRSQDLVRIPFSCRISRLRIRPHAESRGEL
ncbi:hypothetical protein OH76DRAFT_461183 [Lentinus brumalis]|uniref:Uncharacterized protein n=1 Tax=Lentinus brumalis TaxID=2498619 RepID=A0A371CIH3_9APHY|nr:hypothetical protein OH76DRAFT_461183 [Polyporus brumalis]